MAAVVNVRIYTQIDLVEVKSMRIFICDAIISVLASDGTTTETPPDMTTVTTGISYETHSCS